MIDNRLAWIVNTTPAIASAIYHTSGVRIRQLPITMEAVLRALEESGP